MNVARALDVLQRIATAGVTPKTWDSLSFKTRQLCAWLKSETQSGKVWEHVKERGLAKHAADAASNCLKQLVTLFTGTFEPPQSVPVDLLLILDSCGLLLSAGHGDSSGTAAKLGTADELTVVAALHTQILQTGRLYSFASSRLARLTQLNCVHTCLHLPTKVSRLSFK